MEVACKAWRVCKVLMEVIYLLQCNREVTWISGKRLCSYEVDGGEA